VKEEPASKPLSVQHGTVPEERGGDGLLPFLSLLSDEPKRIFFGYRPREEKRGRVDSLRENLQRGEREPVRDGEIERRKMKMYTTKRVK
jgi:hypothetical protein